MAYHSRQDRSVGRRRSRLIGLLSALLWIGTLWRGSGATSVSEATQTFFEDVTEEAIGVPAFFEARSIAFGDYDNDGWPDLFLAEEVMPPYRIALLHNEGESRFADRTAAIQADIPRGYKGGGVIFGDYDNDGDLDLFVPMGIWRDRVLNMLLRNDQGVFRDVTLKAGLTDVLPTDNAISLDYNRDGYLDLYVGNTAGRPQDSTVRNKLHRNNGDDTFTDVTEDVGLDVQLCPKQGGSNGGMAAGDFNDDGWPDLYVGVFGAPNRLFLNDGQGGFRDATTSEIGDVGQAYGVAVGDIDNDGDLDIYQAAGGNLGGVLFRSVMLLNLGKGQFLDMTEGVGLSGVLAADNMGAGLADIDNDGDLDLVTGTPHFLIPEQRRWHVRRSDVPVRYS